MHADLTPTNILLRRDSSTVCGVQVKVGRPVEAVCCASRKLLMLTADVLLLLRLCPRAQIADFGLSMVIDEGRSHLSGRMCGSPFYVAPEVR